MIELDVIDRHTAEEDQQGVRFWRSPADRKQSAAFKKRARTEFQDGASEPPSGASRRQFLQLMGASMAMAGLTACRRPEAKILPYARKPEEVIPGVPQFYATAMPFRGLVRPLVAESHEGRPTKVEGNADHPDSTGGTSAFEQASLLHLYDPDRSRTVLNDGSESSWQAFVSFCRDTLAEGASAKQVAVLYPETSSPTVALLRERLAARFPALRWVSYAAGGDDPVRLATQQRYGRPLRPRYAFDEAEVIVSLDADFLAGHDRDFAHNSRTFAAGRKLDADHDDMSRLYVVESAFTSTGGGADHRLRLPAHRIATFAAALAAELGVGRAPAAASTFSERERLYVREIARDLQEAGARGVVLAGETQAPAVHALALAINDRLGATGTTVRLLDPGEAAKAPQDEELRALVKEMNAGRVEAAFFMGVNPVYDAPAALGFADAMKRVSQTVHVGLRVNETARAATWHVPQAHYLESWGDGRAYDGTLSVIQPMIAPLYDDAHADIEVLNVAATGIDAAGYDLVRERWREVLPTPFESNWRRVLHDGYLPDTQFASVTPPAQAAAPRAPQGSGGQEGGYELVFRFDPKVLDGSYANNAWMQELPDPTTKIVWDNVALVSPATARELGVEVAYDAGHYYADRVAISAGGERIELPVWVQPGYPDGTIGLNYGYGRAISMSPARSRRETPFWDRDDYTDVYGYGPIAGGVDEATGEPKGTIGVNVAPLAPARGRVVTGATVEKAGGERYEVVTTQEHGSMEGRPIIRWATLDEYKQNPDFPASMGAPVPGDGHDDDGHGDGSHGSDSHDGDGHDDGHGSGDPSGDGAAHGTNAAFATPVTTVAQEHGGEQARGGEQAHGGDGAAPEREGDAGYRDYPMPWESRHPKDSKAYTDNAYYDNQWGMVIDLNTCTGCNACVVACTSENNVQVVGKEEVSRGRHMYWLRMDRYYVSDTTERDDLETDDWRAEEDPAMMMQPVMCQHCENAPCESVCPVAATVHSPDGTNQMIYNRCIGTRYCSNNCPYKVRRFNFYNWTKTLPLEVQMAQNPNVSVRFRGVMEKCSFCIHRVRHAQRRANNEMRSLKDGEVQTACQQACPADAIVFGDLNNPDSRVVQEKKNSRRYELLAQLNVKPRLSYLGRVRNTNPRLEAAPGEPVVADAAAETTPS